MLCPSCHTPNRENANFCKKCGLPFTAETLATSSADIPSPADTQGQMQQSQQARPALDSAVPENVSPSSGSSAPAEAASSATAADQQSAPAHADDQNGDDPALAPTQILTPQTMLAYQSQKWQHEVEREHPHATPSGAYPTQQAGQDIAEAPTMLMRSNAFADTVLPTVPAPASIAQPDIAEMPTILIAPTEAVAIPPPPPPESLVPATPPVSAPEVPTVPAEEVVPTVQAAEPTKEAAQRTEPTALAGSTNTTSEEEDAMEQVTPPNDNQIEQDQPVQQPQEAAPSVADFPVLPVGTLVAERYEVTQVISEDTAEHIYQVTDHQGYHHCWNCGSEENAEGDEFCITCGAELLNASYILHTYPPTGAGSDTESHVLQGTIINTFVDQGHTYVVEQPQAAQASSPNGVRLVVASDSDAGDVRRSEPNEDSTLVLQLQRVHESISTPLGVFIVADGMGGHENGQGASRMTIGTIAERMTRELVMPPLTAEKSAEAPPQSDEDSLVDLLHGAVEDANTAICQTNQHDKTDAGSTITGFMVVGDHAYILNVGDSRTYMLRDGNLYQLTNDHSLVGQLVAGGLIEPEDVYTHPQRSQIYRSLGDKLNVQIDIFKQQIHPGDILLSCSDGLWEMVRNPQITEILSSTLDPQTACSLLIEAANANGGEDNVSAVVVYVR